MAAVIKLMAAGASGRRAAVRSLTTRLAQARKRLASRHFRKTQQPFGTIATNRHSRNTACGVGCADKFFSRDVSPSPPNPPHIRFSATLVLFTAAKRTHI